MPEELFVSTFFVRSVKALLKTVQGAMKTKYIFVLFETLVAHSAPFQPQMTFSAQHLSVHSCGFPAQSSLAVTE